MADAFTSRSAEAVIDEVSLLQAALQEAQRQEFLANSTAARNLDSPSAMDKSDASMLGGLGDARPKVGHLQGQFAERFNQAVTVYGVQLKSWIDIQVDARLSLVLPGLLEGQQDTQRLHMEISTVTDAQAKLLAVVEGISEELARLKASVAACHLGTQLSSAIQKTQVSEKKENDELRAQLARYADALSELQRNHDEHAERVANLGRRHDEAARRHERSLGELGDAAGTLMATKREVGGIVQLVQQLEGRLCDWRTEMGAEVAETKKMVTVKQRQKADEMGSALEVLRLEFDECKENLTQQLNQSQARWGEELAALQKRLITELRAETTAAIRSEAGAVAALDEQIWLTDQRLGQRIDELAQLHSREMADVSRALSSEVVSNIKSREAFNIKASRDRALASSDTSRRRSPGLEMAALAASGIEDRPAREYQQGLTVTKTISRAGNDENSAIDSDVEVGRDIELRRERDSRRGVTVSNIISGDDEEESVPVSRLVVSGLLGSFQQAKQELNSEGHDDRDSDASGSVRSQGNVRRQFGGTNSRLGVKSRSQASRVTDMMSQAMEALEDTD